MKKIEAGKRFSAAAALLLLTAAAFAYNPPPAGEFYFSVYVIGRSFGGGRTFVPRSSRTHGG